MLKTHKRTLSLLLAFLLLLAPIAPAFADDAPQPVAVERIEGADRYDTSLRVSKTGFTKSRYAVVASGESFPDALAGGQLAGYLNAPLMVTPKTTVSDALFAELDRLGVTDVFMLGGEGTLSAAVQNALSRKYTVERLEGADRIETSEAIATKLADLGYGDAPYYANGYNFPDALAAAPYVVSENGVMRLVDGKADVAGGIALGGEASVPGKPDRRIAGADRYATAVEIANAMQGDKQTVILVDGTNYPDALGASGYADEHGMPILLTAPNALPAVTADFLKENRVQNVIVIGGANSVSEAVIEQVRKINAPQPEAEPTLYNVVRVVDGDTIVVDIDGKEERVRLIGIDTPESVHPDSSLNSELGRIASKYTTDLLAGKKVSLETDVQERDHYGRLLAYVYLDGEMVNRMLLTAGMARVATYPPNVKYADEFLALEKTARDGNVGLWGDIHSEPDPGATEPPTPGGGSTNPDTGPDSGQYCGSKKSDKFHYPSCRYAKKIASHNLIWFKNRIDAQNKGYQPCKVCKP